MGFPSAFGEGYELEDGLIWDAITFDLAHATSSSNEVIEVELSRAPGYATKFSVSNRTKNTMHIRICNITAEDQGKVYKISPGKTRHVIQRIPRRAVLYYRFVEKS